jgi:hypothetical protein
VHSYYLGLSLLVAQQEELRVSVEQRRTSPKVNFVAISGTTFQRMVIENEDDYCKMIENGSVNF